MHPLGQKDRYWGLRALDFVDAVDASKSPTAITNLFKNASAEAGFSAFVMCGLPDAQAEFCKRIIANGWPEEWLDLYLKNDFAKDDPVERNCLRTVEPFDWVDAPYDAAHEPKSKVVMDRATDFNMVRGFCIPIHYGDGSGAAVSISGERPDFGRGVRAAMHLMALYAHQKVRRLLRPEHADEIKKILTPREREVVAWARAGKSDWEIGQILHISERTARAHMQNAGRKLHSVNRVSTIVIALQSGEIAL